MSASLVDHGVDAAVRKGRRKNERRPFGPDAPSQRAPCRALCVLLAISLCAGPLKAAETCAVPTAINGVLTPVIASPAGLSLSAANNSVTTNGSVYKTIASGTGSSLNATLATLQNDTLALAPFLPATFPATGSTDISRNSGGSISNGNYNSVTLNQSGTFTFTGGEYRINAIVIKSDNTTLTLAAGDYFINDFDSGGGNNGITLNTVGTVRLFIGSSLAVHDNFNFNATGSTANLQIYLYAGASLLFHDRGTFNGLVYSPATTLCGKSACVTFHDSNTIKGAVLSGNSVSLHKSNAIDYSQAVRDAIASIALPGCVGTPDHYELSLPVSGVVCESSPVKITACATATTPCVQPFSAASGHTVTLASSIGSFGTTSPSFNASGIASTTLSAPLAKDGDIATVTLSGVNGTIKCCPNGSACYASASCKETFKTAGLLFSGTVAGATTALANTRASCKAPSPKPIYYLRAVSTGSTTGTCQGGFIGKEATRAVKIGYQCKNPASCSSTSTLALNGTEIASNAADKTDRTTDLSLTFDGNGNASFTFDYFNDAGQLILFATIPAGGNLLTALSGQTGLIVAPEKFLLDGIPDAPLTAGDAFNATVTAVNACDAATPNFGRESPAATRASITSSTPKPRAGNAKKIDHEVSYFNNGAGSASLTWSEVGTVDLTANSTAYLGSVLDVSSAVVTAGRFRPAYFDVARTFDCTTFNYASQPFKSLTVTAMSKGGTITRNYTGKYIDPVSKLQIPAWSRDVTLSPLALPVTIPTTTPIGSFADNTGALGADSFTDGIASVKPAYALPEKLSGPIEIGLRAKDSDAGTSFTAVSSQGHAEPSALIRSGRLVLFSAYGSERSSLQIAAQAQFWSGLDWVLNDSDSCTTLPVNAFALSGDLATRTKVSSAGLLNAGKVAVTLDPPTGELTGSVDVAANLGTWGEDASCLKTHGGTPANVPWLRSRNGDCTMSFDRDPSARAGFGIYSAESGKTVHIRERF